MTDPTPSAELSRALAAPDPASGDAMKAREIAQFCIALFDITDEEWDVFEPDISKRITAALNQSRTEGARAQMERDCAAVCGWCADQYTLFDGHVHMDKSLDFLGECAAAAIRKAGP